MKLTGHWSVSSFITVALTAASYLVAVAVILSAGLAVNGVIFLVAAEVFRAGTQLAEDQSLTI